MEALIIKGKELNAKYFGVFSKNGFSDSIEDNGYQLISIDDLFNLHIDVE